MNDGFGETMLRRALRFPLFPFFLRSQEWNAVLAHSGEVCQPYFEVAPREPIFCNAAPGWHCLKAAIGKFRLQHTSTHRVSGISLWLLRTRRGSGTRPGRRRWRTAGYSCKDVDAAPAKDIVRWTRISALSRIDMDSGIV